MRFAFLALLLVQAACVPRSLTVGAVAKVMERGADAFYEERDPQLGREAMASQLKLLEALLKNAPDHPKLLALVAQGFGSYAFLFLEDAEPERARALYLRGRDYGLRLASRNRSLRGLETLPLQGVEAALGKAGPADVPGLFWAAFGWGGWINLSKDSPEAVAGLPKAAAVMRRVEELSPGFYYGGPDLFLGSYYATLPRMMGGSPEKSRGHFESAIHASSGRFLLTKVLYARYGAVAAQDESLFRRLLAEVLASPSEDGQMRLANEVAKGKAQKLLKRIHDLF